MIIENMFEFPSDNAAISLSLVPDMPDLRDRVFSSAYKLEDLPLSIDYTSEMSPVKNQASSSMCTGFAASAMKEWQEQKEHKDEVEAGKFDHRVDNKHYDLSEQWIYYKAREIDGFPSTTPGSTIRSAMKVLHNVGVPIEAGWPFHESVIGKPEIWGALVGRWYKIGSYSRIYGLDQLKGALISNGPSVAGIGCFAEIFNVGNNGIVADPANPRACVGGHAILMVGYDDDTQLFKFKNSWGNTWGDNGYGYLSYNYVTRYMWDAWIATDISVAGAAADI